MASQRVRRGRETEQLVADYLSAIFPAATRIPASLPGRDILNTPGIAVEVKARRGLDITGWLKAAVKNRSGEKPILIFRPDGYGEARIDSWPAVLPLEFLVELLYEAGYGTKND